MLSSNKTIHSVVFGLGLCGWSAALEVRPGARLAQPKAKQYT